MEKVKNRTLHSIAEEAVKQMICDPEYQNGKLLPNEIDLAKSLNISRNTLRQAINKLVFEGRLCRKKGYGTWVTKKSITGGVKNWLSFSQEMSMLGIKVRNYELHVSNEELDDDVSVFFGLSQGAPHYALKLERVRGDLNNPFVLFISYFNPKFDIDSDNNFSEPLYEILETKYDIVVHKSVEKVYARLAGKTIASKLRISENDPILIRQRYVYDTAGKPVEYNIGYYRADSFTYTITAERQ